MKTFSYKDIFACLFSAHNTMNLSGYGQVCLITSVFNMGTFREILFP